MGVIQEGPSVVFVVSIRSCVSCCRGFITSVDCQERPGSSGNGWLTWKSMRLGAVDRIAALNNLTITTKAMVDGMEHHTLSLSCQLCFWLAGRLPPPPSPPSAATTATEKLADSEGDTSNEMPFRLYPSGTYHQVLRPGSGPQPTRDQSVKYDWIGWEKTK